MHKKRLGFSLNKHLHTPFFLSTVGDGRKGYPEEAPYDAIHVGAAAPTVPKEVKMNRYCFTSVVVMEFK